MNRLLVPKTATVYTPSDLASAMVGAIARDSDDSWLDPCVGDGVFVDAISAHAVPSQRIRALDISARRAERDALAQTSRGVDFIAWAAKNPASADNVVMNPPYVALSRVRGAPLKRALAVRFPDGTPLPFKANYWCAFVLRAIECVRPEGSLAAVLPASWDFARYARPIQEAVAQSFGEVTVVRCLTPLFPTVKDGAVVLVAKHRGVQPSVVRRLEVADPAAMLGALREVAGKRPLAGASVLRSLRPNEPRHSRLDELVKIRIGAVTGDARYFLLTEDQRVALGLPLTCVLPALSRSQHLNAPILNRETWIQLRDRGSRVWLFRPRPSDIRHPAVRDYLLLGEQGRCNTRGYKVRSRDPWHSTPLPKKVDGFLSGMSKKLPFLVLREMDRLCATNTLYVVSFREHASRAARASVGLALLTSAVRRELAGCARLYADGLLKFEPAELGRIRVPVPVVRPGATKVFKEATALLLAGREVDAECLADAWVHRRDRSAMSEDREQQHPRSEDRLRQA